MRRYLATNAFNIQYAFITHNKFASKNHIIKKPVNKNQLSFNKKPVSFNKKSYELTEKRLKEMNRDIFLL